MTALEIFSLLFIGIVYLILKEVLKYKENKSKLLVVDHELENKIKNANILLQTLPVNKKINREAYENMVKYSKYMLENFSDADYVKYRNTLSEKQKEEIHTIVFTSILRTCDYIRKATNVIENKTHTKSWENTEAENKEILNSFLNDVSEETSIMSDFFNKFVRYF